MTTAPTFESAWFSMVAFTSSAYAEVVHGLGRIPDYVRVVVKTSTAPNNDFYFEGSGMAQNSVYVQAVACAGCAFSVP